MHPISKEQKEFFEQNGYLILKSFYPIDAVERARSHIDALWEGRKNKDMPVVMDAFLDGTGGRAEQRMYFRDAPDDARSYPYKLNQLHLVDTVIQDLAISAPLAAVIEDLLGHRPLVCNTLLFEYGSQQKAHFDTFYMPSPSKNMMTASWIALEKVTLDNGPLFYYPGSHLIEPYLFSSGGLKAAFEEMPQARAHIESIIKKHGLKKEVFTPDPGDLLIWHAQLLHSGNPINDKSKKRASLVTHYFTMLDYPDREARIDLGDDRYLLNRRHDVPPNSYTRDQVVAFLNSIRTPESDKNAVPLDFDPIAYLLRNPDVYGARADPYTHFVRYGRIEGRRW